MSRAWGVVWEQPVLCPEIKRDLYPGSWGTFTQESFSCISSSFSTAQLAHL